MAATTPAPEAVPQQMPSIALSQEIYAKVEPTANKTGYMFLKIGESAEYWLNSCPDSDKPLLDLGAAYGVHSLHAMKHGRDVIAADIDAKHIEVLKERCEAFTENPPRDAVAKPGRLIRAEVAKLPTPDLCEPESVSGVLLSEVLHFFHPKDPLTHFKDVFRWLIPGGRFVSTSCSAAEMDGMKKAGVSLHDGRTFEELEAFLDGPAEELVDRAPTYLTMPEGSPLVQLMGKTMYLMTLKELQATAEAAGFEVERCSYISPDKYPFRTKGSKDETAFLVARKPFN